jgi:hypothetical protein
MPQGANEFTMEDIENFLSGDWAATPAADDNESSPEVTPDVSTDAGNETPAEKPPVTETQAFAHRLKEATNKARNEERESIAKSLGYESYADMQAKREAEMLRNKGFDPEEVSPIVDEIVKQRLAEDPRMQELDGYKQERMNAWAKKELAELNELTDGKIATMADIPADVLELWKTKGSLKKAYLELHGEELIRQTRTSVVSGQSRGSTSHMNSPQGTPPPAGGANKRPFTAEEKAVYKMFNPDVTDEQLNKMYKDK